MSDQNKATARRLVQDHWNEQNPALIEELFATSCAFHTPDGALQRQDGARQLYNAYATAFPDFRSNPTTSWLTATRSPCVIPSQARTRACCRYSCQREAGECSRYRHFPSRRWQGRRSAFRLGQVCADATDRCVRNDVIMAGEGRSLSSRLAAPFE